MIEKDKEQTSEERLEEIKREEEEDASVYYSQNDSKEEDDSAAKYNQQVEPVKPSDEEMSFLKTVAFLGFGLAALAIVFILFFIRDLDERVVHTDQKADSNASTVARLDGEIEPFKEKVNKKIAKISGDVNKLEGKIGDYERMMAVMELKRAMVTIQEVMGDSNIDVKSKTGMVVSSIESLLSELDIKSPKKSSDIVAPDEIKSTSAEEVSVNKEIKPQPEIDKDENGEVAEEGLEKIGEENVDTEVIPALSLMNGGSVGEIQLSTEEGEEDSEEDEELPPIEDLLNDE